MVVLAPPKTFYGVLDYSKELRCVSSYLNKTAMLSNMQNILFFSIFFPPYAFFLKNPVIFRFTKVIENVRMNKIIAVDFDGTLCENEYPNIGAPRADIISKIILKGGFAVIMLRSNKRKTAPTIFAPVFDMVF